MDSVLVRIFGLKHRIHLLIEGYANITPEVNAHFDDILLPGLHLGSQDAVKNRPQEWTHIVTLRERGFNMRVDKPIKWYRIIILDDDEENIRSHFRDVTEWIHEAVKQPRARVLVHCQAGASRSPTVVCAYLIRYYGASVEEALGFINRRRTVVPNEGFMKQLEQYASSLRRK